MDGRGQKVAMIGEKVSAVLYIVDQGKKPYTTEVIMKTVECEGTYMSTGKKLHCEIKKMTGSQYEISYSIHNHCDKEPY